MNGELGGPGHPRSGVSQLVRRRWRDLGHVYLLVTGSPGRLRIAAASSDGIERLVDGLVEVLLNAPRKPQDLGYPDQRGRVFPSGNLPGHNGASAVAGRGMDQVDSRPEATGKADMLAVTLRGALPW